MASAMPLKGGGVHPMLSAMGSRAAPSEVAGVVGGAVEVTGVARTQGLFIEACTGATITVACKVMQATVTNCTGCVIELPKGLTASAELIRCTGCVVRCGDEDGRGVVRTITLDSCSDVQVHVRQANVEHYLEHEPFWGTKGREGGGGGDPTKSLWSVLTSHCSRISVHARLLRASRSDSQRRGAAGASGEGGPSEPAPAVVGASEAARACEGVGAAAGAGAASRGEGSARALSRDGRGGVDSHTPIAPLAPPVAARRRDSATAAAIAGRVVESAVADAIARTSAVRGGAPATGAHGATGGGSDPATEDADAEADSDGVHAAAAVVFNVPADAVSDKGVSLRTAVFYQYKEGRFEAVPAHENVRP